MPLVGVIKSFLLVSLLFPTDLSVLRSAFPGGVGGRQYVIFFSEIPGEVFRVIEPYFVGNLGYGELAFRQQLGGVL